MDPSPVLVLLDFDGTLVDSRKRVTTAMAQAYDDHGLTSPAPEAILGTVGLQPNDMLSVLFPELTTTQRRAVAQRYRERSLQLRASEPEAEQPFPGAHSALLALRAACHRLGVVTGKSASDLEDLSRPLATRQGG